MIRLLALAFAAVLFLVPYLAAPVSGVVVPGLIALLLAAGGIAVRWRWPVTTAACLFLTDYAAALWVAEAPVSVGRAAGFGLALLLLLQFADLGGRARHATIDAGVIRSQIVRWMGFGAATLAVAMLVMSLAGGLAASVPFAASPLLAAAGVLGVMLALTAAARRPGRPTGDDDAQAGRSHRQGRARSRPPLPGRQAR